MIKAKELKKLLKEQGRHRVLSMYANCFFDLSYKQLEKVLESVKQ